MNISKKKTAALDNLYTILGIPFSLMAYTGEIVLSEPPELSEFYRENTMQDPPDTLGKSEHPAGITLVETGNFSTMAIVKIDDKMFASTESVFSSSLGSLDLQRIQSLIKDDKLRDYAALVRKSPVVSNYQLASYASAIKFIITGENAEGVNFYHMSSPRELVESRRKEKELPDVDESESSRHIHEDYYESVLRAVVSGSRNDLESALNRPRYGISGTKSSDSLQQKKYDFITELTPIIDKLIQSGMDRELMFSMFDNWCYQMDMMHSASEIDRHHLFCLYALCDEAGKFHSQSAYNPYTRKAILYIQNHIYDDLNTQTVASAVSVNRNSLSAYFKKDMNVSVREYIISEKLKQAAVMLKKYDMPIIDISMILSFSSQSHFSELFYKAYGKTPLQYRKNR